jgi:hypothetical protein
MGVRFFPDRIIAFADCHFPGSYFESAKLAAQSPRKVSELSIPNFFVTARSHCTLAGTVPVLKTAIGPSSLNVHSPFLAAFHSAAFPIRASGSSFEVRLFASRIDFVYRSGGAHSPRLIVKYDLQGFSLCVIRSRAPSYGFTTSRNFTIIARNLCLST